GLTGSSPAASPGRDTVSPSSTCSATGEATSMQPEAIAAVLHGLLVGPVAPEIEQRRAIAVPTLIVGHDNDLIHPFSDAENLAQQIPNARLVQARSMFELRLPPARLTGEITRFLDAVFTEGAVLGVGSGSTDSAAQPARA